MPLSAGIGFGGQSSSDLSQVPHLWLASCDRSKFASAHVIAGTSLASGSSDMNAVLGGGLKISTGSILWRPGKRVPAVTPMRSSRRIPEPHSFWMRVRLPEENNDGVDGGGLRLGATRVAPAGARFGIAGHATGQVHQPRRALGTLSGWTTTRPTKIKGHAFFVQELPVPVMFNRSGASWLKVMIESPSQSRYVNNDGSTRPGPSGHGRLSASLQMDMEVDCDYSKMTVGVHSRYSEARGSQGVTCSTPLELFAKFRHNKQILRATWRPNTGVRIDFSQVF